MGDFGEITTETPAPPAPKYKDFFVAARDYHSIGLKVIPFWNYANGGRKYPEGYGRYKAGQTMTDIETLFEKPASGIAVMAMDGIEVVDIDTKHDPTGKVFDQVMEQFEEHGITTYTLQKTKSGGYHIVYRCPEPGKSQKLARREGCKEAFIETRGVGSIFNVWPTPGYEVYGVHGFMEIPTITQHERDNIIGICRLMNEVFPQVEKYETKLKTVREVSNLPGKKPWEDYDERTDIVELMESFGWRVIGKSGKYVKLNRPDAKNKRGVDATCITDLNLFHPFSSSTEFEPDKSYSPSSVYAIMKHRGNYSEAAKQLYTLGYGDRFTKTQIQQAVAPGPAAGLPVNETVDLEAELSTRKFDYFKKYQQDKPIMSIRQNGRLHPIAGRGMIGIFIGHEKSGKSFLLSCIEAAAVGGKRILDFELDLEGGKLLHFDNEQSEYFFDATQRRILKMAGVLYNPDNYHGYHLRPYTPAQRIELIETALKKHENVSVLVIDGFVDLVYNYNDLKESQAVVQKLMTWSDQYKCLILGVLHLNKGDGKIRGHIGSEGKNKADFIIKATKSEGGLYTVENTIGRYGEFTNIEFSRGENGELVYSSSEDTFEDKMEKQKGKWVTTVTEVTPPAKTETTQTKMRLNDEDVPF